MTTKNFEFYAEVGQTLYKYNGEKIIEAKVVSIDIALNENGTFIEYAVSKVGCLDGTKIQKWGRSKEEAFRLAMLKLTEAFND